MNANQASGPLFGWTEAIYALHALSLLTGYASSFLGTELQLPLALAVLMLVLIVRPAGLFGQVVVRRV